MTTMNTGAASLSDEQKRAAITACALMIKGICLTTPNAEWTERIENRIHYLLRQIATTPQADAAPSDDGLIPRPDLERDPLWQWRCIANEAEVAVNHKGKFLMLSEEMCVRLGAALEDAAIAAGGAQEPCATCNGHGMIGGPSYYAPDEGGELCPDCAAPLPREAAAVALTDERIVSIWEGMPDGASGFRKSWGYLQFARALLAASNGEQA